MEPPDKRFSEFVGIVKSWMPWRSEPSNVSRDFWMPDKSCRVCYECDSQFTVFNRRHHCRLCGRVFCARCTLNSVLVSSADANNAGEVRERIRVCSYCFKRWEQEVAAADNGIQLSSPVLSPSVSTTSLVSTKSSGTGDSSTTAASILYLTGAYSHGPYCSDPIGSELIQMNPTTDKQDRLMPTMDSVVELGDASLKQFEFCINRSDDDDDEYDSCRFDSGTQHLQTSSEYHGQVDFDEFYQDYQTNKIYPADETADVHIQQTCSSVLTNTELHTSLDVDKMEGHNNSYELNASSTIYGMDGLDAETVDIENNNQLWQPPEPEDEEDEREPTLFDNDDDDDATGEWGYLRSSNSFGSGEYRSRDRSSEEHKMAMKNVVGGHFRALIAQLLQVENLPVGEENNWESWLEIITSLSWEAATLLKPDTSKGGGMDPGGYVKIKCIASGRRCNSMVVKGVVCKKNVAHRRMPARIEKPRFLILGGALEYQRVTNTLSSVDTLLQQEMDHLKMAVSKIAAHHPNVLLVEKSVSRFAQDYLLAQNISLVLNIKRALLERIARCTGAQILPSIDHLSSQKLGYCDLFHVEKYFEEHGSAGQGGKKLTKTLMFFEGCPKPLGCTILLQGANGDELKKVKHVVQYGVFAAYHLALETSFLADEGASLPELPLKSPITVALPDKPSSISRSISTFPSFSNHTSISPQVQKSVPGLNKLDLTLTADNSVSPGSSEVNNSQGFPMEEKHAEHEQESIVTLCSFAREDEISMGFVGNHDAESFGNKDRTVAENYVHEGNKQIMERQSVPSDVEISHQENNRGDDNELSREDFSTSDHQSILVSLSSRCIWKGTVCERAHLFRIKYYGSFDKPLGRFLRDNLFDESYRCRSCELPPEAHVHCYTHRQGSLTISVRKQEGVLPGERDGKIWMWHRCLRCPRINGFPPATRRVVMSDAAWGLSFGKFLELSFSNNAAASRVASCGHSLHRDCLRFYGFGKTVACFRYAPVNLHSVYLPPSKLDFNYQHQEWIQKEADEVAKKSELLFTEVLNKLHQIADTRMITTSSNDNMKVPESRNIIADLEGIVQKEKDEFKDSLQKVTKKEPRKGQPAIDILEINKLRRQLLFQSYFWDQRLICAANSCHNQEVLSSVIAKSKGSNEKISDLNVSPKPLKGFLSLDALPSHSINDEPMAQEKKDVDRDPSHIELSKASSISASDQLDQMKFGSAVRRVHSEGQFLAMADLSDTFDARWIGENGPTLAEASMSNWIEVPFSNLYRSINKDENAPKVDTLNEYKPVYVSLIWELERQSGARLLLPIGVNGIVIPVYDDEPTSIISYALVSSDFNSQMLDDQDKIKESGDSSLQYVDDTKLEALRNIGPTDDSLLSLSSSKSSLILDPLAHTKALHPRVSFYGDGSFGKVKYTVTCYYAKRFEALRRTCCPSELDFIRSISRCKKWGAQGGKSNVFFAKSLDDRFVIKQVTKTELESFITFAPEYFKYLSESISTGSPTCLAKILGIYQITTKNLKGGKETRMDVLMMENLLFGRTVTRLYDLKGSSRSRYNPDSSGQNKVLLDQNLIEAMPTSPIFLGNKAKRLLERAVWNDTAFLASIDVMDYSLLVGIDEENHELVLGIIDFMRQYTWDKHLETWVKASGILGGPKNESPTVISPKQYKKRFRKAMSAYFLVVPDQWSPPTIIPSMSQSELSENVQLALNQSSNQS